MQLNKYLHKRRTDNGYSMRDLAKKANVSVSTICNLERENYNPNLDILSKVANVYGLEVWRLLKQAGV